MKILSALPLIAALHFPLAHHVFADELSQIKSSKVFRVGTAGDYPPYAFHNQRGLLTGFDVEIAEALARRLGTNVQFIEGKWDGLIAGLDAGRYDAVVDEVLISESRKARYDFSDSYIKTPIVLIVQTKNSNIHGFADLKGKKVAQTYTSTFARLAESNGGEVVPVESASESFELLVQNRVDAVIHDEPTYLDFQRTRKEKLKIVAIENSGATPSQAGVVIRKNNPELLLAINKALADIKADGTYLTISKKYFGQDLSQ
ncbi:transporter substrate-binding domain-containing protein [uncultured Caballeronia sp.]|uniref:transporter substrate-binding domain-containing protein n=1 Tax=uncultured Caballeronia sp. TaxID=1827198 RepID=UPI0035CA6FF6